MHNLGRIQYAVIIISHQFYTILCSLQIIQHLRNFLFSRYELISLALKTGEIEIFNKIKKTL